MWKLGNTVEMVGLLGREKSTGDVIFGYVDYERKKEDIYRI